MQNDQVDRAIIFLKEKGIESHERMGILAIHVDSCENLDQQAKDMKRLLDSIGYNKSWQLDPYYKEAQNSLTGEMYNNTKEV